MPVEVGRRLLQDSGLILGKRVLGTGFGAVMDTKSDRFYPKTTTIFSQGSIESALGVDSTDEEVGADDADGRLESIDTKYTCFETPKRWTEW